MLNLILTGKFQQQTSKQINVLRNSPGEKTWQPNYYDHVIRDVEEYERIQQYIINNPTKWEHDSLNGKNKNDDNNVDGNDGGNGGCRENS
jgi:hypothetical protein